MDLRGKTILVTGGCGLIGSTIVDQLLRDEQVAGIRIIDDLSRGTRRNIQEALGSAAVELIEKDIRNFEDIRPHFEGVDVVFHQAALRITACAQSWRACQEVLVDGTFNVVDACVQANVRKLIAASSASVYGLAESFPTPETHHLYGNRTLYGAAKIANEALYRSVSEISGLEYVALRYFNVYGPRMDIFGRYTEVLIRWLDCLDQNQRPQIFGDGRQTMDFVFSEDVARANLLAARSAVTDEVFNIASGYEISLYELLKLLLRITGQAHLEPQFVAPRTVNPVPRRCADVTRARARLQFEAATDLETGLRRLIGWRRQVQSDRPMDHCAPSQAGA